MNKGVVNGDQVVATVDGNRNSTQLHNWNHLSMVLVTTPLTGSNFRSWSQRYEDNSRHKAKNRFVDGIASTPKEGFEAYNVTIWSPLGFQIPYPKN